MANITKIKAKDPNKPQETPKKVIKKEVKKVEKTQKPEKEASKKKPFVLFRPFCAIGRYFKESWHEIRQVRWPNRKATWKMVLAVFIYSAIFLVLIIALDALFTFLFNLILS